MQMIFRFPRRDGDLLPFLLHFHQQVAAEREALGVSEAEVAELAARVARFEAALLKCEPAVRSKAAVINKEEAGAAARTFAHSVAISIAMRNYVSAPQKQALNIRPRKPHTRSHRPTERPVVTIAACAERSIELRLGAGPSTVAGAASVLVFTFVGKNYPADASLWQFCKGLRRPRCRIDFPDNLPPGVQVWVCAAYCSRRGERGEMSLPVTTNLQMGGVGRATTYLSAA
ncbi:MAG TPA: hypothetical protein VGN72_07320 [Tepidisphaeraceae bacterium]|jgi:hypothetical protein|nr:hypothetical protein [Tepidisphaeraceae bacterium]